jgi:lipid-A-disaccharide synthase-like uncharacterized protein
MRVPFSTALRLYILVLVPLLLGAAAEAQAGDVTAFAAAAMSRAAIDSAGLVSILSISDWIWANGKFLGIEWHAWKVVGWLGNAAFFSRFLIQWFASERQRRIVVPVSFWWLSLAGSLLLLAYAVNRADSVFIFAYGFTWIPYIRNLIIHNRSQARIRCAECEAECSGTARFCSGCGARIAVNKDLASGPRPD